MTDTAFSLLLCQYRGRTGLSRNRIALEAGVDPSYLTRLEHGDREPPRQYIVEALGRALGLSYADTNQLLTTAGYSAQAPWSPAMAAVAEVQTCDKLSLDELDEFQQTILLVCKAWRRGYE